MTLNPALGQIIFPFGKWIPNTDQITDSAAGMLAICGKALDDFGIGDDFKRRVFTHGDNVPIFRGDEPFSQLIITFTGLELGEAGAKQFQYDKGAIGQYTHMVGGFKVEVWKPWPLPQGGLAPTLAEDGDVMATTMALNECVWVVFSALRALSLAGVAINPPVTPIQQDKIIVGPAAPVGPQGGMAGYAITVQIEYD